MLLRFQPFKNLAFLLKEEHIRKIKVYVLRIEQEIKNDRPYSQDTVGFLGDLKKARRGIPIGYMQSFE